MTESFVDLADRGVTLCIARAGEGPPLLVMNGTGSDLRNQPNALKWPLAKDHDVLVYDHRCLGRSTQHDSDFQPSMSDFAIDALALCDEQGIAEFSAIGTSFGGMVAQEVAIRAGDRLKKLVLCCTSSGGEGGASYPLHDLYASGRTTDDIFDLWDTRSVTDDAVAAQLRGYFEGRIRPPAPPPGLLKQIEARRTHDTWSRLDQITAATLVAYGIHDGVAPPENSERLAQRIPNAELASFDAGHMFKAQDQTAWPAIGEFLAA